MPLGTYRMEETKGLIDRRGTVGLHGANGHNGSIEDHVVCVTTRVLPETLNAN